MLTIQSKQQITTGNSQEKINNSTNHPSGEMLTSLPLSIKAEPSQEQATARSELLKYAFFLKNPLVQHAVLNKENHAPTMNQVPSTLPLKIAVFNSMQTQK